MEVLDGATKKRELQPTQIVKEEVKLSLHNWYHCLHNHKASTKRDTRINESRKVVEKTSQ